MSDYKQCPNGHYYQGDHCPYCNSGGQTGQSVSVHCPYCGETIAVNVSSYDMHMPWNGKCKKCQHDFSIDNDVVRYYPSLPCPHCGKQVTDNLNEKWDGKCVNCGHDFTTDWIIIQKMEKEWSFLQRTRAEAESNMIVDQWMQMQKDKKVGNPSDYKQCPNGHYYQGENCPYCHSQQDEPRIYVTYVTVKACPNRHAYDKYKQECPVCGSKEVIKEYECRDSEYIHVDFIVPEVIVNEKSIYGVQAVRMCVSQGNTYHYAFVDQMKEAHSFEPGDDILVGTTRLKGREIMRMCDLAMDNNLSVTVQNNSPMNEKYKQCSNGHYYQGDQGPFGNSKG